MADYDGGDFSMKAYTDPLPKVGRIVCMMAWVIEEMAESRCENESTDTPECLQLERKGRIDYDDMCLFCQCKHIMGLLRNTNEQV